jgi:hypothetical protein
MDFEAALKERDAQLAELEQNYKAEMDAVTKLNKTNSSMAHEMESLEMLV